MFVDAIPPAVERPFAHLLEQVRAACALPIDSLSTDVVAQGIRDLRAIIDIAETGCSQWLRAFELRGGPRAAGATSTVAWVRSECHVSGPAAAERVEVGRRLEQLPLVTAALQDGQIGFEHAAVLARTASDVGVEAVSDAQEALLAQARTNDPGQLRAVARSFSHSIDAAAFLQDSLRMRERRGLRLYEGRDGMTVLEGRLDPESGAIVRAALDRFMMPGRGDTRTAPQRRVDALREIGRRIVHGVSGPHTGRGRPHMLVTATDATLRAEPGAPAAEMGRGAMVPAETAQRMACDAFVTVVRLDANGQPLGPGRTHRTVKPGEWAAMVARDHGCRWPQPFGCDAPLDWCDGHHLDSWVYTKKTEIATSVVLCEKHHHYVHEEGWTLLGHPAGELTAIAPLPGGLPAPAPAGMPAGVPGSRVWRQRPGAHRAARRTQVPTPVPAEVGRAGEASESPRPPERRGVVSADGVRDDAERVAVRGSPA